MKRPEILVYALLATLLINSPAVLAQAETAPVPPAPIDAPTREAAAAVILDDANPNTNRYEAALKPYGDTGRLSDSEIVEFIEAVKSYVYGQPPAFDTMKIFDRTKMDTVVLKYEGVYEDPECHQNLGNGFVALCGKMTSKAKDQYVVYFVCRRKSEREERKTWKGGGGTTLRKPLDQVTVRDVAIKSVNGVDLNKISLGPDGLWKSEPVAKNAQ